MRYTSSVFDLPDRPPPLRVIICSPSGAGKTTLCHRLLARFPDFRFSVSHTTRPKRPTEVDGRDYHFVDAAAFERMVAEGAFAECAYVHGNRYGTSNAEIARAEADGRSLLFDIDHQGATQIKQRFPDSVAIFILPPSLDVLRGRLTLRGTETPQALELRYRNALDEIRAYVKFDYLVINDDLDETTDTLAGIIAAERSRVERRREVAERLLRSVEV